MDKFGIGIAIISLLVSIVSAGFSYYALIQNKKANESKSVLDLHNIWKEVNDVDIKNPLFCDVKEAHNAMLITAILWNKKSFEQHIINDTIGETYIRLYEKMSNSGALVSGTSIPVKNYINDDIRDAYENIKKYKGV